MAEIPTGYRALANSERQAAAGAARIGASDPKEKFTVTVRLRTRPGAPPMPEVSAVAASPRNRAKRMSREEYESAYGAAQADLDAVGAFAKSHGLTVTDSSSARRSVVLSGTADQLSKAFGVELHQYQTSTETYRSREGSIYIPENLADVVESVHGFDNRPMTQPLYRGVTNAKGVTTPQGTSPLTPPQVAKLYQFPTNSAAGQTIGILEFGGGYKPADITNYFTNVVHLPVPTVVSVGVDGATNSPGGSADTEVILDISVAGSVAPGAKLVVYFAPNTTQGWQDCLTTAIHDSGNRPSVLSVSWGGSESGLQSAGFVAAVESAMSAAAALGVTIFFSSGDGGSGNPAGVLYPASSPQATGCGGTTIQNVSGSSYTQVAWAGSGGGISNSFGKPYWQSWAGIPVSANPAGHVGRGVPDIAGNGDPNSGYMLILNGASTGPWGGTSAVAPLYAGLMALLNASLGEPLGYLNYNLYAFQGPYVFNDVTSGSNGAYASVPGWDAVTGLGSVVGTAMATALEGIGLPPGLAVFNSKLYMAWKGIEFDERIFFNDFTGSAWTPQQLVGGVGTSAGVSLAVFNGQLYMAWKGLGADQGIYYSHYNGATWAQQQLVGGVGTSTGPRLAVFNGKLYMAWKGVEGDQRLFYSSFNGTTWAPQVQIPGVASSVGSALAVFGNVLYAIWKGQFGDQGIYWSTFNGAAWAPQKQIAGVGTSEGPSLAVFNGRLYAAWKGQFSDQRLWFSFFNGVSWAPQAQIPGVFSSIGPNIQVFGNAMYMTWKGELGDQRIWYTNYNGSVWAPQQIVPGVGTSTDLIAHAGA